MTGIEFWAICDLIEADNFSGSDERAWVPYVAVAYNLPSWTVDTQADPSTGAPNPGYGLVHGWADQATLDAMAADDKVDLLTWEEA